jgi:hypothetical protein
VLVKLPPPRAQLVRLPAPRAQLADDLPPLVSGNQYLTTMPYQNLEVLATYKGQAASVYLLPTRGNQLGDMWAVGNTTWLWVVAPGASRADWIDP